MKTRIKLLALTAAAAALAAFAACSFIVPEYAGTWVDDETLYGWTITLEFGRRDFTISMTTYDAVREKTVGTVTSGVMTAGGGVMRASVTGYEID